MSVCYVRQKKNLDTLNEVLSLQRVSQDALEQISILLGDPNRDTAVLLSNFEIGKLAHERIIDVKPAVGREALHAKYGEASWLMIEGFDLFLIVHSENSKILGSEGIYELQAQAITKTLEAAEVYVEINEMLDNFC